jgi:hypothetical protein
VKLIVLVTLHAVVAVPWAICQDQQLHQRSGQVSISASTIQRDISQATYTPVIQLKGNVEIIKLLCVPAGQGGALVCEEAMVLHADEAEYREDTGEIKPSGNVRVSFQKVKELK